jgi:hypothetical protein
MAEINATLSPINVTSRQPTQEEIDAFDYEQFKAEQAAPLVDDTELADYQQFKAEQGNPLLDWVTVGDGALGVLEQRQLQLDLLVTEQQLLVAQLQLLVAAHILVL